MADPGALLLPCSYQELFNSGASFSLILSIKYTIGELSFLYKISTCTTSSGIVLGIKSFINNDFNLLVIPSLYAFTGWYSNDPGANATLENGP